jgi:hypothetical protein
MDLNPFAFQQARIQQVVFKSRLRSVLHGVRAAEDSLFDAQANPVQQWLDAFLQPRHGALPEVGRLRQALGQQLAHSRRLVQDYQRGRIEEARAGFALVEAVTDEINALLATLEQRLRSSA